MNLTDYPTPITDAAPRRNFTLHRIGGEIERQSWVRAEVAEGLERQLAEARELSEALKTLAVAAATESRQHREQRDRLAEALMEIKRFATTKASRSWLVRIAIEALANLERKDPE